MAVGEHGCAGGGAVADIRVGARAVRLPDAQPQPVVGKGVRVAGAGRGDEPVLVVLAHLVQALAQGVARLVAVGM